MILLHIVWINVLAAVNVLINVALSLGVATVAKPEALNVQARNAQSHVSSTARRIAKVKIGDVGIKRSTNSTSWAILYGAFVFVML